MEEILLNRAINEVRSKTITILMKKKPCFYSSLVFYVSLPIFYYYFFFTVYHLILSLIYSVIYVISEYFMLKFVYNIRYTFGRKCISSFTLLMGVVP